MTMTENNNDETIEDFCNEHLAMDQFMTSAHLNNNSLW